MNTSKVSTNELANLVSENAVKTAIDTNNNKVVDHFLNDLTKREDKIESLYREIEELKSKLSTTEKRNFELVTYNYKLEKEGKKVIVYKEHGEIEAEWGGKEALSKLKAEIKTDVEIKFKKEISELQKKVEYFKSIINNNELEIRKLRESNYIDKKEKDNKIEILEREHDLEIRKLNEDFEFASKERNLELNKMRNKYKEEILKDKEELNAYRKVAKSKLGRLLLPKVG